MLQRGGYIASSGNAVFTPVAGGGGTLTIQGNGLKGVYAIDMGFLTSAQIFVHGWTINKPTGTPHINLVQSTNGSTWSPIDGGALSPDNPDWGGNETDDATNWVGIDFGTSGYDGTYMIYVMPV